MTGSLAVDCNVYGGKRVFFFVLCGLVIVGYIVEKLYRVFVGIDSTISSFTKCDVVWISCYVKFVVLLDFSFSFLKVQFRLFSFA